MEEHARWEGDTQLSLKWKAFREKWKNIFLYLIWQIIRKLVFINNNFFRCLLSSLLIKIFRIGRVCQTALHSSVVTVTKNDAAHCSAHPRYELEWKSFKNEKRDK